MIFTQKIRKDRLSTFTKHVTKTAVKLNQMPFILFFLFLFFPDAFYQREFEVTCQKLLLVFQPPLPRGFNPLLDPSSILSFAV